MGAATSLLYTSIDQNICGIVCDSPFATLKHLVDRFGEFCVSKNVYEKIYPEISKIVKEKTGLVIEYDIFLLFLFF
jgi:hypothetical protein